MSSSEKRPRVAVFISGHGSDLQALIDASQCGDLTADIVLVVSNNPDAYGLQRARAAGMCTWVHDRASYADAATASSALCDTLRNAAIDYIALAGYLKLLPKAVIVAYPRRIVNIHPALLPRYGGKGMYGRFVHEAVLASGDKESGASVHLVDEQYDHGRILEQLRVPVLPGDTPETLAARVLKAEHQLYPKALQKLIQGDYAI